MSAWEYMQGVVCQGKEMDTCQEAGADGWELVAMIPVVVNNPGLVVPNGHIETMGRGNGPGFILMFKRQKPEAWGQSEDDGRTEGGAE